MSDHVKCPECGESFVRCDPGMTTWVDYMSPGGHDHDDNCVTRVYYCVNDHATQLSIRRMCRTPLCDWRGRESCDCHSGKKLDKWPSLVPREKDAKVDVQPTLPMSEKALEAKIAESFAAGHSIIDLARDHGVSLSFVEDVLRSEFRKAREQEEAVLREAGLCLECQDVLDMVAEDGLCPECRDDTPEASPWCDACGTAYHVPGSFFCEACLRDLSCLVEEDNA